MLKEENSNMNQMEMAARCLMNCATTFNASSLHPLHPLTKFICFFIFAQCATTLLVSSPNIPISPSQDP